MSNTLELSQHIALCEQCRRAIQNAKTKPEWNVMACKLGKKLY